MRNLERMKPLLLGSMVFTKIEVQGKRMGGLRIII
jgi:hypothetical protein